MSVITRTNRATNPRLSTASTGYAAVAGTGGTASGSRNTGTGYTGQAGFFRTSWTVATTALGGGGQYTQTGLSANTSYPHTLWVRSSKAQTVRLVAQYQNASAVNVGSAVAGSNVALAANTWTPITVTATSGAAVDRVILQAQVTTGGSLWANGDWFDIGATLIGATGEYFDGGFTNANSTMYAWAGTAHASNSTATVYTPALALVTYSTFDPCPRVEITLTDVPPTSNKVTIWRTADGKRQAVRGFRKREVVSADFVTDFEPPLNRSISYQVEVVEGLGAQVGTTPVTATVNSTCGVIQDPLVPGSAVPVYGEFGPGGQAYIRDQALKELEYAAEMSIMPILGSPDPVAIMGQRLAARGVDMSMTTRAAQSAANMRNLLQSTPLVLVRPLPAWSAALPGLCYMAVGSPTEMPVDEAWGGQLIRWGLVGDLVAAPAMNVLVPLWTYGDVKNLWGTYQQAQTALSGKTYLDVLKKPSGS